MADVAFTPSFTPPTPWVDGRDRVRAAGSGGFNDRFSSIADDFASLQEVVGDISSSLKDLGRQPDPVQQRITLSPALVGVTGTAAWTHDSAGFASQPAPSPASPVCSRSACRPTPGCRPCGWSGRRTAPTRP